jgi:hypothetical protein
MGATMIRFASAILPMSKGVNSRLMQRSEDLSNSSPSCHAAAGLDA